MLSLPSGYEPMLFLNQVFHGPLHNRRVMETYSEMVVSCPEMQLRLALRPSKVGKETI